jgi:hypothetical protein
LATAVECGKEESLSVHALAFGIYLPCKLVEVKPFHE